MNKRKKVLCITRKYPPQVGGMENFCYHVFNGFDERIIDKKIIALGKHQINLIWFFPYVLFYVMINIRKYDVLLIGDSVLCFLGNIAKLCSRKTKRKIIIYGLDFLFDNSVYQLYLKMWLKHSADEYVCISKGTRDALEAKGILCTSVITPGIEVTANQHISEEASARFKSRYGINDNDLIIITVGRLVKRKGVEWFIRNVMSRLNDYPVHYLVIGDGNEKENIDAAIGSCQLNNVHLLGRISEEELLECYSVADVFVMPNIHVENDMEGFGIVAVEASAAGLIVLASGIEGISDAVIDEKNGYLLESENVEMYEQKIKEILENRLYFKSKAKEFQQYTIENYSWETICKKYTEFVSN